MNLKETNNNPPPAAAEALPVLDYAQPKPVVSVWQLVEILRRYGFAFGFATLGTLLFQVLAAALLGGLPRHAEGEAVVIPYWTFITLVVLAQLAIVVSPLWKLSRHPIGRTLLFGWTILFSISFAYLNGPAFYKAWSRGW